MNAFFKWWELLFTHCHMCDLRMPWSKVARAKWRQVKIQGYPSYLCPFCAVDFVN